MAHTLCFGAGRGRVGQHAAAASTYLTSYCTSTLAATSSPAPPGGSQHLPGSSPPPAGRLLASGSTDEEMADDEPPATLGVKTCRYWSAAVRYGYLRQGPPPSIPLQYSTVPVRVLYSRPTTYWPTPSSQHPGQGAQSSQVERQYAYVLSTSTRTEEISVDDDARRSSSRRAGPTPLASCSSYAAITGH